ncbi:MAG: glycosyltransferase family 4 protein [Planctomycetota bacterium]
MRVLIVAKQEPWPLNSGGRLHLYHVATQLARHADVTLALNQPVRHRHQLPPQVRVWNLPTTGTTHGTTTNLPVTVRLARRHFGGSVNLDRWLGYYARPDKFDVLLLNGAVLGQHAFASRIPVIWNPQDELVLHTIRDAQYAGLGRWPTALRRAALYGLYERAVAHRSAATIFVSPIDAAYARRWMGDARVEVVPNGTDFDYFQPRNITPAPRTIVFVGSLEFPPNVDGIVHFTTRVWPRLHARDPRRRLLIVGRRPVPAVMELAARSGVEIAADVPDVRPYLTRAAVVLAPTRKGGGLKNKILEACAMRRPLVVSSRALGGLSARPGRDLLTADSPGRWVDQIEKLLERPAYAAGIAHHGYDWVHRHYSWQVTGQRFFEILASAACLRAPRPGNKRQLSTPARFVPTEKPRPTLETVSSVS